MGVTAGTLNLALGVVYIGIAVLIATDLDAAMRRRGWSHFGVSWLTIMFTCGAHHLVHGVHLVAEGRGIGVLDVLTVALGIPAGGIFSWLRVRSRLGHPGDRTIVGTPPWLRRLAMSYAVLMGSAALTGTVLVVREGLSPDTRLLPNMALTVLYVAVGAVLWRGQHMNRRRHGAWSLSGLSLMMIFPTCALMHAVYVVYAVTGRFSPDYHGLWVDWLGVPAAMYFLWVVRGLEKGTLSDWNDRFEDIDDVDVGAAPLTGALPR